MFSFKKITRSLTIVLACSALALPALVDAKTLRLRIPDQGCH